VFFFFPIIYYLTHPEDYYRRPIDQQYVVLAAFAVASWVTERKRRRGTRLKSRQLSELHPLRKI
jgi:hypothetical protein